MKQSFNFLLSVLLFSYTPPIYGQTSALLDNEILDVLTAETSGEMALNHFSCIIANYSGFAPSLGADKTAEYIADKCRGWGLTQVEIRRFASDGKRYFWAFRTEPWWEAKKADVWLIEPTRARIASFDAYRGHLARFSRSTQVETELIAVGLGTRASDYADKSVRGKIVLASGRVGTVHALAVWQHGAAGVIIYRTKDADNHPDLISSLQIAPRNGANGEPAAFAISISYQAGRALLQRLRSGEKLVVRADIETQTHAGHYPQVHAVLEGRHPELPEVWIQAHTNHRNTGGGNNLTGVGATLDLARTLATLIKDGRMPRPRRTIRFSWGAEHMAALYDFFQHPEQVDRILAYLDLDMVGDHQVRSESILRLYRTTHSRPSFINDIIQEMFEVVAAGNTIGLEDTGPPDFLSTFTRPIIDPSGSRDPFYYHIENFWGPSDHEDVGALGIDAVLLNTWPDPYIGTQEDTRERADATQMKRAEVITGGGAYILASAGSAQIPVLVQNALQKTRSRLADEERIAMDSLAKPSQESAATRYREARNRIVQSYRREVAALQSLDIYAETDQASHYLARAVKDLSGGDQKALNRLQQHAATIAEMQGLKWTAGQQPNQNVDAALVPQRTDLLRGPVNVFRSQYGSDWLKSRLHDPDYLSKLRLAHRGIYYCYEALNFADGKLNLAEIGNRLAAEYGPVPVEELAEYFEMLRKAGVVALKKGRKVR